MITDSEHSQMIPGWVPKQLLGAVLNDASGNAPTMTEQLAGADAERVYRAVVRADGILAAHPRFSEDDVVDVALARSALLVVSALVRSLKEDSDG